MSINIVRANKDDCKALSKVKHDVWNTTYRGIYEDSKLDDYDYKYHENKFIDKLDELYVIKDENDIVGYFSFGVPRYVYKDYKYCINSLYILNTYQGKGIGKKVVSFINDYCKDNNIDRYFTNCNKYNENALGFYLKMGGVITSLMDDDELKEAHQYFIEFKKR